MELNFFLLVIAALMGMVIKAFVGWDPLKLLGSLTLALLFLPVLGLVFETDPEAAWLVTKSIIERVAAQLPSIMIGEVAGVFAVSIFDAVKGLFKSW